MANIPGFESIDKIRKEYPYFDLNTRSFSEKRSTGYLGGIPLMFDFESRRLYIDSSDTHSLVYGSTGSLKTRTIVSPGIKVLGYAGESMIINDPKGELFTRHAGDLKKQGYNIVEINFRDPSLGNSWNPLYIPYQFYINGDLDKSAEFVNDIANNLMVSDRSTDDPFWDFSASDLLYGLIQLLFRYCKDHSEPINAVNIGNLLTLRRTLFSSKQQAQNTILWKYASEDELVAASLSGSVYAPKDTMNSILSVFDQKMRSFTIQPTLLEMLANNDFDIADIGQKKTAVFLITPDEKTSYHRLVSMFVKESYEYLIFLATQTEENKVENRINYILDEFSSLPKIADMPSMISAARSRDIRFLLVVQSQSSLKQRYADEAETIISNCTNWIFFTSRELGLLRELSELCGTQKNHMPNISVYDLQHLSKERRESIVLAGRLKPCKVSMLDIDRFGDRSYILLEHEKRERMKRNHLTFELSEDIKKKYIPQLPNNPFEKSQTTISGNPQGEPFDIDATIKAIDKKIAELEAEEKREKEAQEQKNTKKADTDKKGDSQ
jgi:type IV secretory pathway TraG/TraD family ATPase VirD4